MIQRGCRARLVLKSSNPVFIFRELPREDLECNVAAKLGILGEVDLAHPARSDEGHDAVVSNARIRWKGWLHLVLAVAGATSPGGVLVSHIFALP